MKNILVDKPEHHHHHRSFLNWLTHIKHHHDKRPIINVITPENKCHTLQQDTSDDDSASSSHSKSTGISSLLNHLPHGLLHHHRQQEDLYLHENSSRHSSVSTLLEDMDSRPSDVGFKKLKDGILIDWEEKDMITEELQIQDVSSLTTKSRVRSVMRHDLLQLALSRSFQSPMNASESKKHVLHIGCGDGSWCIETASLFPNWLIVGMDDQTGGQIPDQRKVPKNFKYIRNCNHILSTVKDIPDDSFDLVYSRFLVDVYGDQEYMDFVKECKRICKPNGYVELYELDMRIYGNPRVGIATHKLNSIVFSNMENNMLNPRLARKLNTIVSQVFYESEPDTSYMSLPLGIWGGKLGVLFRDCITDLYFEYYEPSDQEELVNSSNSSDISNNIPYNKDIEIVMNEMDIQKSFMNLHYVFVRK